MCAQMLMPAIARRGCTDSVRESALNGDREKSLAAPGTQISINIVPGFSVGHSTI